MRVIRIHVPGPLQSQDSIVLPAAHSHRLLHVLRLKVGDALRLFDGVHACDVDATITAIKAKKVQVTLGQAHHNDVSSPLALHVMPALLRPDKMDWVIQKSVELGVHSIRPVLTQYSQKRGKQAVSASRMAHWQQTVIHACEQCGRSQLPALLPAIAFADIIDVLPADASVWYADPGATTQIFKDQQGLQSGMALLIGPEGGFSTTEVEQLLAWKAHAMYLGPRILRAETAAVSAMTLCQHYFGDLQQ